MLLGTIHGKTRLFKVASIIEINQGDMSLFPIMFIVNGNN